MFIKLPNNSSDSPKLLLPSYMSARRDYISWQTERLHLSCCGIFLVWTHEILNVVFFFFSLEFFLNINPWMLSCQFSSKSCCICQSSRALYFLSGVSLQGHWFCQSQTEQLFTPVNLYCSFSPKSGSLVYCDCSISWCCLNEPYQSQL